MPAGRSVARPPIRRSHRPVPNAATGPEAFVSQPTRHNHFVPQHYLRAWSADGHRVWSYATLVPHANCPEWELRSTRGLAAHDHLYTARLGPGDADRFERRLHAEIEQPAEAVIAKMAAGRALDRADFARLARYAFVLNLRTPVAYGEYAARAARIGPDLLHRTLTRAVSTLERAARRGDAGQVRTRRGTRPDAHPMPTRVRVDAGAPDRPATLGATFVVGRAAWLHSLERLLGPHSRSARAAEACHWRIIRPFPGRTWWTSDHPVVRLNYYGEQDGVDRYDFGGGWGNPGSEILVPLTPDHLLYAQVGAGQRRDPAERRGARRGRRRRPASEAAAVIRHDDVASAWFTTMVQRFVAERAHRWVFASEAAGRVRWFRPRHVNADQWRGERESWQRWDAEHSAAESELADPGSAEARVPT